MSRINVAVIGSGGREHAICWKLSKSPLAGAIYALPGNGGIPDSINIGVSDFEKIESFCIEKNIKLIVVGPEVPLVEGISDYFRDTDIKVFGPEKAAARLEGSKAFAKEFMRKYAVATASYNEVFAGAAEDLLRSMQGCVIKFDGLAAGKGVYVCQNQSEALAALADIKMIYGPKARLVVEELLIGDEISVIGITDGCSIKLLSPSQDHKQAYDGDQGPNTGGMGAFTPVPFADDALMQSIHKDIVEPTMHGLQSEAFSFVGVVYFGIMVTKEGPKLLEYNARFGDPETEIILPALKSDLLEIILSCFDGTLKDKNLEFEEGYFIDLVLASGGYPGSYDKGKLIRGTESVSDETLVFHAGTIREDGKLVTSGGRVLNVVCSADTLDAAIQKVYAEADVIDFDKKYMRTDIGRRERVVKG